MTASRALARSLARSRMRARARAFAPRRRVVFYSIDRRGEGKSQRTAATGITIRSDQLIEDVT